MDVKEKLYQKNLSIAKRGLLWGLMRASVWYQPDVSNTGDGHRTFEQRRCSGPVRHTHDRGMSSGLFIRDMGFNSEPEKWEGKGVCPLRKN